MRLLVPPALPKIGAFESLKSVCSRGDFDGRQSLLSWGRTAVLCSYAKGLEHVIILGVTCRTFRFGCWADESRAFVIILMFGSPVAPKFRVSLFDTWERRVGAQSDATKGHAAKGQEEGSCVHLDMRKT